MQDEFVTEYESVNEASRVSGLSGWTIRDLVRNEKIRAKKCGKRLLIDATVIAGASIWQVCRMRNSRRSFVVALRESRNRNPAVGRGGALEYVFCGQRRHSGECPKRKRRARKK